ncbi:MULTISPECIES: ATP-dependent DNA helicase [unclassified Fusibacter]|uniref:ATP-dependent DNA helicase n=1 Tax=unclassified Fusibacter TaxID=2624464 RepID=UPI001010C307|nr:MULTISPECIES: ATP-dependent DNA helicase [unclassified Fusibacter]MCK8059428.1 ATP-dependent DNA helicase [Fusibacter sp. A2]NPE21108.1 ATP-dependent DNA helicase [Fusibacter sp. A1]RXV62378.1 ATP-dependent DNA helicase [Fusibacter sp. A1]
MKTIKESVRGIIEFIYREGDIDSSLKSAVTMQEGTQIHQMIQSEYEGFEKEVHLKKEFAIDDATVLLMSGRADGIKDDEHGIVIDEIKSTYQDLDDLDENYSFLHWAQAKIYGAIYSEAHGKRDVTVQLTYYSLKNEAAKVIPVVFTYKELTDFLYETVEQYKRWATLTAFLQSRAEVTAKEIKFPFGSFRPGQDVMAKAVYATIRDSENLIIEAPTGIGKTMSTLFPATKALGEGLVDKVFYLTSKTVHRKVALDSYQKLVDEGLNMVVIGLQAKEKMCINDVYKCQPHQCPYANGHFDRVNDALHLFLQDAGLETPESIQTFCEQHVLCPFEFALDLTNFAQGIVCDYNYFFDPFIQIKRHFTQKNAYAVLVDEAHNLHERARDMYSAFLDKNRLLEIRAHVKEMDKGYHKLLGSVNTAFNEQLKTQDEQGLMEDIKLRLVNSINKALAYFLDEGRFSDITKDDEVLDHFFEMHRFLRIYEYFDDQFVIMLDENEEKKLHIRCLDPSKALNETYGMVNNVVCFSATLSPLKFYQQVLGHSGSKRLQVGSPFDVKNRLLVINQVHSTYSKDREVTLRPIFEDVKRTIAERRGNYFVFCPSYAYLKTIKELFDEDYEGHVSVQSSGMTEKDRAEFLEDFVPNPTKTHVGLVVMGGVFSEGIDLHGDRLTGVIIIGVGLPTLSKERQIMKSYYDAHGLNGFDYAFTYPGLNKVFQAGGRLIRTEQDKGILMLIGKRFGQSRYLSELPGHWRPYEIVANEHQFKENIKKIHDLFD